MQILLTLSAPIEKVPERRGPYRVYLAFGVALIVMGYLHGGRLLTVLSLLQGWLEQAGPLAPVLTTLVYSVWATLCLPGPPILGVVGTLYVEDPWVGLLVVVVGDALAIMGGFQIARRFGRERIQSRLSGKPWYDWLEAQIAAKGLYGVFVIRTMPFFPNSLANYALGLTGLPFWPYVAASVAGSIPNLALYVFGSAVVVALIRDGLASPLSLNEALLLILALALLIRLLQRISRQRLARKNEQQT